METIQYYLQDYKIEKTDRNQRRVLMKEIYQLYSSPTQRNLRKKENWKRYCKWCRENKLPDSKVNQEKFKKTKTFIKEFKEKNFAIVMNPIKGEENLYYIISVGKDMDRRGDNFGAYIISHLFDKRTGCG